MVASAVAATRDGRPAWLSGHYVSCLTSLITLGARGCRLKVWRDSGYRLVINTGRDANNVVRHLHVHLLGGLRMTQPPG